MFYKKLMKKIALLPVKRIAALGAVGGALRYGTIGAGIGGIVGGVKAEKGKRFKGMARGLAKGTLYGGALGSAYGAATAANRTSKANRYLKNMMA